MPYQETEISMRKLIDDCKVVVNDAEALLKETANQAGEKISATRQKIQDSLVEAKIKLRNAEDAMIEKTKRTVRATNEYVQDNPWQSIGVAAGVGAILGLLLGNRRNCD